MALIACSECGREISDKALACPGCGAPVERGATEGGAGQSGLGPDAVMYDASNDTFTGTTFLVVQLAMRAVQDMGWTIGQANEALGLVTFETGMTLGSWSGVTCSLRVEEVATNAFRVTGTGKQNVRGGQVLALNLGREAESKAEEVISRMRQLALGLETKEQQTALGVLTGDAKLAGRALYHSDGAFRIEGEGAIGDQFVRLHQSRGQIAWSTPQLHEWAIARLGPTAMAPESGSE